MYYVNLGNEDATVTNCNQYGAPYCLQNKSFIDGTTGDYHGVWLVHEGDIAAVPVAASVWLFGGMLLGLVGIKHRYL